jgi:hypothetical protein
MGFYMIDPLVGFTNLSVMPDDVENFPDCLSQLLQLLAFDLTVNESQILRVLIFFTNSGEKSIVLKFLSDVS